MLNHVYKSGLQSPAKNEMVSSVASIIDGGFSGFSDSDDEEDKGNKKYTEV